MKKCFIYLEKIQQYELTLQRLATVQIAKFFMEKKWVKDEWIRLFTDNIKNQYKKYTNEDKKDRNILILKIQNNCKLLFEKKVLLCTYEMKEKLLFTIELMGIQVHELLKKIYPKWIKYDLNNQRLIINGYINRIIWTDIGTINYKKTVINMLNDNQYPNNYIEVSEACINCFDNDIDNWYKKNSLKIIDFVIESYEETFNNNYLSLTAYSFYRILFWNIRRLQDKLTWNIDDLLLKYAHLSDWKRVFTKEKSIDTYMFFLCITHRHYQGINYFWSCMTNDNKLNNLHRAIENLICIKKCENIDDDSYGEKLIMTIFFLQKTRYEDCDKKKNISYRQTIDINLLIAILTWPWYDFNNFSLNNFEELTTTNDNCQCPIIINIILNLIEILNDNYELLIKKKQCRDLLFKLITYYPQEINNGINIDADYCKNIINNLIKTNDILLITTFINHSVMKNLRNIFLNYSIQQYKYLLINDNNNYYHAIEMFKEQVLLNDKERRYFTIEIYRKE